MMDTFCHKSEENNHLFPSVGFSDWMKEKHMRIQLSIIPDILLPILVLVELPTNLCYYRNR